MCLKVNDKLCMCVCYSKFMGPFSDYFVDILTGSNERKGFSFRHILYL